MASKEGKYNIKAISTMLGIQPGTLRAWERRYKIVEPIRNQVGHRLYSDEHVAILRWLIDKVKSGFTIRQAVDLFNQGNVVIADQQEDSPEKLRKALLAALLTFNESEAHLLLNEAFVLFGVKSVTIDLFRKLLVEVKSLRKNEKISAAHEQFIMTFIKMKIGNIFQGLKVDGDLPKVVAACGVNETNELGMMIFSLFLRRKGYDVLYLGTSIPLKDLKSVIEELDAKMFFTSCMKQENLDDTVEMMEDIKKSFPGLIVGTGGYVLDEALKECLSELGECYVGETKQEWENWLHRQRMKNG